MTDSVDKSLLPPPQLFAQLLTNKVATVEWRHTYIFNIIFLCQHGLVSTIICRSHCNQTCRSNFFYRKTIILRLDCFHWHASFIYFICGYWIPYISYTLYSIPYNTASYQRTHFPVKDVKQDMILVWLTSLITYPIRPEANGLIK